MCDIKRIQVFSFPDLIIYSVFFLHFSEALFFKSLELSNYLWLRKWWLKALNLIGKICFQWSMCEKDTTDICWPFFGRNPAFLSFHYTVVDIVHPLQTLWPGLLAWNHNTSLGDILHTITIKYLCLLAKRGVRTDQRPLNLEHRTLSWLPPDAPFHPSVNWRF